MTTPGRPPIHDAPMIARQITMTAEQWAKVREIGNGKYAEGVRVCVDAWKGELLNAVTK